MTAPLFTNVLFSNVWYYQGKARPFEDLSESRYLHAVLQQLQHIQGKAFRQYSFFIYSDNGGSNTPFPTEHLIPEHRNVLIYLSDETGALPHSLTGYFQVIFKCYIPAYHHCSNVFNFPLGPDQHFTGKPAPAMQERTVPVSFAGQLHPGRKGFYEALSGYQIPADAFFKTRKQVPLSLTPFTGSRIEFSLGFRKGLPPSKYQDLMYQTQIALCPPGHQGPETFRHYEAAMAGCVVVSEPLPGTWFYREAPFVLITDWSRLQETIDPLLHDPELLEKYREATLKWFDQNVSPKAVAEYMADLMP